MSENPTYSGDIRPPDLEAFDIGTYGDNGDRFGPWVWSEVRGRHIWLDLDSADDVAEDAR